MKLFAQVDFQKFNEKIFDPSSKFYNWQTTSLGIIISEFLKYFFPFAGLALFIYLLIGGFTYLSSGGDQKAMEKAQSQITNAVIGFVIIFAAFWVVQIFEFIFNIQVFK